MNRERRSDETYDDYKQNLKQEQIDLNKKLKGSLLWFSSYLIKDKLKLKKVKAHGTYVKSKHGLLGEKK